MARVALIAAVGMLGLVACQDQAEYVEVPSEAPTQVATVEYEPPRFDPQTYYADRGGPPWYQQETMPQDLRSALADDLRFLGEDNVGYRMHAGGELCEALTLVEVSCDYNSRMTLSIFLAVNGKGMFPASGGTNPYVDASRAEEEGRPSDVYIGRPIQNRMLQEAILRNQHLFRDGNLTAEDVQTSWQ